GAGAGAGAENLGRRLACEQPGGVHQQRGAHAASASSAHDARAAGPEAAVLELSGVSHGPPPPSDTLRVAGGAVADDGVVGTSETDTGATTRTTVRTGGCGMRKSRGPPRGKLLTPFLACT